MRKELLMLLAGTTFTASCAAPPAPPNNTEIGFVPTVPVEIAATPTIEASGYITQVPDFDILDPAVRATEMVATAQSVQSKGIEGLKLEGYPENAFTSQRRLQENWTFDYIRDGSAVRGATSFECDTTLVNIPEMNAFVFTTVTHCIAPEHQTAFFGAQLAKEFPGSSIQVQGAYLEGLQLGGKIIEKNQFGIAYNIDPNFLIETGGEGIATVFVSKSTFTPEELVELEADAITLNDLRFDEVPDDGRFYGLCTPGEIEDLPVIMHEGRIVSNSPTSLNVGEYLSGHGCSGSGIFLGNTEGKAQLASVLVGSNPDDPTLNKVVATYKLSTLGANGYLRQITEAQTNWLNRGGQ
jgi:hypothetical protein